MVCAAISIGGFTLRGLLKLRESTALQQPWIKVVPHINDTILLSCAVYLSVMSRQYPLTAPWLSAKLAALLLYIGLGMVVMRFAHNRRQRQLAFALALVSFAYIVAVAMTRSPLPGF